MKLSIEAVNKCCSDHELIWFWHYSGTSHQTQELLSGCQEWMRCNGAFFFLALLWSLASVGRSRLTSYLTPTSLLSCGSDSCPAPTHINQTPPAPHTHTHTHTHTHSFPNLPWTADKDYTQVSWL